MTLLHCLPQPHSLLVMVTGAWGETVPCCMAVAMLQQQLLLLLLRA